VRVSEINTLDTLVVTKELFQSANSLTTVEILCVLYYSSLSRSPSRSYLSLSFIPILFYLNLRLTNGSTINVLTELAGFGSTGGLDLTLEGSVVGHLKIIAINQTKKVRKRRRGSGRGGEGEETEKGKKWRR
jgi:hypothetical protein